MSRKSTLHSLRQYAAHRKQRGLHGQSHTAVARAIADGRLDGAAERSASGRWKIDPAKADRLWADKTVTSKQRGDAHKGGRPSSAPEGPGPLFGGDPEKALDPPHSNVGSAAEIPTARNSAAMRRAMESKATYDAALKQLDYEIRAANLVSAAEMRTAQFTIARTVRDSIQVLPDRIAPQVVPMDDEVQVRALLTQEINTALRDLIDLLSNGTS